jgi:hypothetical protein
MVRSLSGSQPINEIEQIKNKMAVADSNSASTNERRQAE